MPTKDFGRLYVTTVKLPRTPAPPTSIAITHMTEPPYRKGYGISFNRTWLVPLAFLGRRWWLATFATWLVNRYWAKGYVVGVWGRAGTADQVVRGYAVSSQEIRGWKGRRRR